MFDNDHIRVHEFVAHSTQVNCAVIGPKSTQVLATGGEDTRVNIWRVGGVNNIWTLDKNKSPILSLCFDSDEVNIVSGARNGSLKVFDLNEGKLARNLGSHQVDVTSVQYHPYGEFLVSGSADCAMKFWDVRNKTCVETYTGHKKEITCVRFSPDGKWVASASKDGQLLFYDLIASKFINSIRIPPAYISSFEFNPTEFSLAAITSSRSVRIWDLETMKSIHSTPPEAQPLKSVIFSNLGDKMFTACRSSLKIWEIEKSLKISETLEIGWENIGDMKVLNNDQIVAASFMSNFVTVWEIDLGVQNTVALDANSEEAYEGAESRDNLPVNRLQEKMAKNDMDLNYDRYGRLSDELPTQLNDDYIAPGKQKVSLAIITRKEVPSDLKSNPEDIVLSNPSDVQRYYDDDKNIPQVVVGEGYSEDMATSMGESFWNRFKQSLSGNKGSKMDNAIGHDSGKTGKEAFPVSIVEDEGENGNLKPFIPKVGARQKNDETSGVDKDKESRSKVYAKRETKAVSEERSNLMGNVGQGKSMNNVNYHEIESKGMEGLAIVGSKHAPNHSHQEPSRQGSAQSGSMYPGKDFSAPEDTSLDLAKCHSHIDRLLTQSRNVAGSLSHRLGTLKILRQSWNKGEVVDTLDHLKHQNLNLDACVKILPIVEDMLSMSNQNSIASTIEGSKSPIAPEVIINGGYKSLVNLALAFGELIRSTRASMMVAGVDLARDARLMKCNLCFDFFQKAKQRIEILKYQFRPLSNQNSNEICELLDQYSRLCNQYF